MVSELCFTVVTGIWTEEDMDEDEDETDDDDTHMHGTRDAPNEWRDDEVPLRPGPRCRSPCPPSLNPFCSSPSMCFVSIVILGGLCRTASESGMVYMFTCEHSSTDALNMRVVGMCRMRHPWSASMRW